MGLFFEFMFTDSNCKFVCHSKRNGGRRVLQISNKLRRGVVAAGFFLRLLWWQCLYEGADFVPHTAKMIQSLPFALREFSKTRRVVETDQMFRGQLMP